METARRRQQGRFEHLDSVTTNADMGPAELRLYAKLDKDGSALMKNATSQLNLSARAYHRVLKLARTIADLAGAESIGTAPLAEALQYRRRAE